MVEAVINVFQMPFRFKAGFLTKLLCAATAFAFVLNLQQTDKKLLVSHGCSFCLCDQIPVLFPHVHQLELLHLCVNVLRIVLIDFLPHSCTSVPMFS